MSDHPGVKITVDIDTFQSLHLMAEKNNMAVDKLIKQILKNYLHENIAPDSGISEKRKFKRKKTIIPALIYKTTRNQEMGRYITTTVLDISIGGTKIAIPLEDNSRVELVNNNSEFEIILHLSDTDAISRFKCQIKHLDKDEQIQSVGASFLACDTCSHEELSRYLQQ